MRMFLIMPFALAMISPSFAATAPKISDKAHHFISFNQDIDLSGKVQLGSCTLTRGHSASSPSEIQAGISYGLVTHFEPYTLVDAGDCAQGDQFMLGVSGINDQRDEHGDLVPTTWNVQYCLATRTQPLTKLIVREIPEVTSSEGDARHITLECPGIDLKNLTLSEVEILLGQQTKIK